jgi:hypothetical protein
VAGPRGNLCRRDRACGLRLDRRQEHGEFVQQLILHLVIGRELELVRQQLVLRQLFFQLVVGVEILRRLLFRFVFELGFLRQQRVVQLVVERLVLRQLFFWRFGLEQRLRGRRRLRWQHLARGLSPRR